MWTCFIFYAGDTIILLRHGKCINHLIDLPSSSGKHLPNSTVLVPTIINVHDPDDIHKTEKNDDISGDYRWDGKKITVKIA